MRFPYLVLLPACALMWTAALLAQSPNGVINGLVHDSSNKVIGGADILLVNDATGVKYSGKTNDDGIYVVPNLPPGSYRLQVSKVGFKTLIKPDIVLNIQDALSISFTLPIGAVFEIVTVEGGASMINTTDASVGTVVDQTYVKNMPLNGRSFQDLILLTPGIVTNSPQGGGSILGYSGEFSVNGQRTESNSYTVDGVSANVGASVGYNMTGGAGASGSVPGSTALGTTQALVSVDDLQEFRVESSTYSAEYGRNPGGQFAFETKSGTNQWHGTAYDYLRNGAVDANDWFNDYFGTPEPALRQNDFGGTLGGPIRIPGLYNGKNKTFFFLSYEGLRLIQPQSATATFVPDGALRSSAAPALQPVLNAFPRPSPNGIDDVTNGIAQYIGSWSNPASLDSTSARFDHLVTKNFKMFFRFSNTASNSAARQTTFSTPTVNHSSEYTLRTYTAGASSVFTSHITNEFRLNYSSNDAASHFVIDELGGSVPVNLLQLSGLGPGSQDALVLAYGGYAITLQQQASFGAQRQWNWADAVSLFLGRQQFKFGVDYRGLSPFALPVNPSVAYIYLSESAVETNGALGILQSFGPAYPSYKTFSAFAQDEWRISERLSLSLGLRWEVNPAPGVTRGLNPYTAEGLSMSTLALAPRDTPLWQTTWLNVAPRLGAAYILRDASSWETVLHGGGGVFFDTGQQLGSLSFNGPGFNAISIAPVLFPGPITIPALANPPSSPYNSVPVGFSRHLQLPYTLQWNASVEQALGKSQALTVYYVGSRASRLLQENQFSTPTNPNAHTFLMVQNGLTADYDALQMKFRRRLNQGLTALASYTWSHCIDFSSENLTFAYQRGNCDFDVRHNLSAAFSYDLPNTGSNRFVKTALHHWGLDNRLTARTAFPVTLNGNQLLQPDGQFYYAGLNLVPGQPIYLYGANCASILQGLADLKPGHGCSGGRAINPNAFTEATAGLGNAPRNFARGFDAVQIDLALRREFPIRERLKLQFRAEVLNTFNHPNFGTVNPTFGQTTFGQATATLANSLGVLSPLYQLGGPRSMQFVLRIAF